MNTTLVDLLGRIHPVLRGLSGVPLFIFILVAVLTAVFVVTYLAKGLQVGWQLWSANHKVRALMAKEKLVHPDEVGKVFAKKPFAHLWSEYRDTVHEMKSAAGAGGALKEWRATLPAETYFTRDVLVDGRLFDDFARHLPGILTGLGIIGTFAGLLEGLSRFDATSATTAVAGLKPLLDGVAHAFSASAIAIGCAMGVTFLSRLMLAYFYLLLDHLTHAIDALYKTGAGEEYLSRLVDSSEKSEAHSAQLKQALVEDLNKMMTKLVERQIQNQIDTTKALGAQIGEAISGSLTGPLERMSNAMETSSKGNSEAVSGMLETMLTGFMAKLEDTFGGQMRGIHEQMDRSMSAMTNVQQALQQLVQDINQSNEQATNRLSGSLEEAMKQSAANQQLLTDQMRQFVEDFRKLVSDEQAKSKRTMDEAVAGVLKQLGTAVESLEQSRILAASQEEERNDALAGRTQQMVGGLSGQVETLLSSVAEQVALTQKNIDAISNVSTRAIDGMNSGALTMGTAAQRFETAGNGVTQVFEKSSQVASELTTTAATLQSAATAVRQGFEKYDMTRMTVDQNVAALTSLIETIRREAGMSQQMMTDLDRIVSQFKDAEAQSREYLDGVNRTLAHSFESFGTSLVGQVKTTIAETDRHLSGGVQHLNGVVQEIASAVSRLRKV